VLVLIHELARNFDLGEEDDGIQLFCGARLLVRPSLLEVNAIAGAVEGDLAGFTATLGANAVVHRRTETLLFPSVAKGATHKKGLLLSL
jgi:hypothetical protein